MMARNDPETTEARFERLFRDHYEAVLRYARRRVEFDAVDDVVEETFLVAWRRLDEVPPLALPWLYGVARNVISTQARGAVRRRALGERLASTVAAAPVALPEPGRFGGVIAAVLQQLSPADREALILVAWEELAPREAARALGESAVAFRVRLHRARRRLRALLEDGIDDGDPESSGSTEVLI
jgi:RNA polymerase sigma-70 factor (ECF subfamily)